MKTRREPASRGRWAGTDRPTDSRGADAGPDVRSGLTVPDSGRARRSAVPALAACVLALAGCRGGSQAEAGTSVSRETFIATYVDLRVAALSASEDSLAQEERKEVLDRHGVTEEDLLAFVDAHGGNPAYMEGVWDEVQERMNRLRRPDEDTVEVLDSLTEARPPPEPRSPPNDPPG